MAKKIIKEMELTHIEMALQKIVEARELLVTEYSANPHTKVSSVITGLDLDMIELRKLIVS